MGETISVPKTLLNRICGMVYATRGEQSRLNYITDEEYRDLVRLRHNGHDSIETVITALSATQRRGSTQPESAESALASNAPVAAKCGKPAAAFIPRWGMSWACALNEGHEGDCQPGGECYAHGPYFGTVHCPHPIEDCVRILAGEQIPSQGRFSPEIEKAWADLVRDVFYSRPQHAEVPMRGRELLKAANIAGKRLTAECVAWAEESAKAVAEWNALKAAVASNAPVAANEEPPTNDERLRMYESDEINGGSK